MGSAPYRSFWDADILVGDTRIEPTTLVSPFQNGGLFVVAVAGSLRACGWPALLPCPGTNPYWCMTACIGRDDTLNLYPAYASGHLLGMASFVSVIAAMMHVQYYGNGIPGRNRFAGRARLVVCTGSC